jgi:hypothetical protein
MISIYLTQLAAQLCAHALEKPLARLSLFRFDVFQTDPAPCLQAIARLLDPAEKSRIVFEPDLRERNFFHSGFPNCASHEWASDLVTIAKGPFRGNRAMGLYRIIAGP